MMQYKSVSDVVNKVKQKLEEAEYQLEKDIKSIYRDSFIIL